MKEKYFNQDIYDDDRNDHMHLCEGNFIKAAAAYQEHRGGRCNFAELKTITTTEKESAYGAHKHLIRNLEDHLGNVRFSYILFQAHPKMVRTFERSNYFVVDYNKLPNDVKERMPQKEDSVCMKFFLPKWKEDRFDLIGDPVGYPKSTIGNLMRAKLANVRNGFGKFFLMDFVQDCQEKGDLGADTTIRKANDVAESPTKLYARINGKLGLNRKHYFDITPLVPRFEKRNDYDAEIQQYPSSLAYNNFPWFNAKTHLTRMADKFINEGQSFIAVCNPKVNEREYFKKWIEAFAE